MLKKVLTPEVRETIKSMVWEDLNEGFADEFVFDPIVLVPEVDVVTGEEYLHIWVVFDGDIDKLNPRWTVGLRDRIAPGLEDLGLPPGFSMSYMGADEWKCYRRRITERAGA